MRITAVPIATNIPMFNAGALFFLTLQPNQYEGRARGTVRGSERRERGSHSALTSGTTKRDQFWVAYGWAMAETCHRADRRFPVGNGASTPTSCRGIFLRERQGVMIQMGRCGMRWCAEFRQAVD